MTIEKIGTWYGKPIDESLSKVELLDIIRKLAEANDNLVKSRDRAESLTANLMAKAGRR